VNQRVHGAPTVDFNRRSPIALVPEPAGVETVATNNAEGVAQEVGMARMCRSGKRFSLQLVAVALLLSAATLSGAQAALPGEGLTVTTSPPGSQAVGNVVTITVDDSYHCGYTQQNFTYTMRVIGANNQTQSVVGEDQVTFTYIGRTPGLDIITVTANGNLITFGPCQAAFPRYGYTTYIWTL
jgi:hypothetical protein